MSLIPLPPGVMTTGQAYNVLAPMAANAANLYNTYGPAAGRAADLISGVYSSYRNRRNIGPYSARRRPPTKYKRKTAAERTAKSASQSTFQFGSINEVGEPVLQRTLSNDPIEFPPQGASVGLRLSSVIRVSGIKLCERFVNTSPYHIRMHYAVLQLKDRGIPVGLNVEFFRNTNVNTALPSGNNRTLAFSDASSGSEYLFSHDCYPINPDKFHVITHMTKMLAPKDLNPAAGDIKNDTPRNFVWEFRKYLKMKGKRVAFTSQGDTTPENQILRVYWWQVVDDADWGTDPQDAPPVTRYADSVVYFTNGIN